MGYKEGLSYIIFNAEKLRVSQEDLESFKKDLAYFEKRSQDIFIVREENLGYFISKVEEYLLNNRNIYIDSVADLVCLLHCVIGNSYEVLYKSTQNIKEVEGGIEFGTNLKLKLSEEDYFVSGKNVWRITYYFRSNARKQQ